VSESVGVSFLERDQAAGELKEREVVLGFFRPADQKRAVAIEPGVAGLDDPTSRAPAGCRAFQFALVDSAPDLGGVAAAGDELVDPGVGVAAVQTQGLRLLG
jgi:hypothetical protein